MVFCGEGFQILSFHEKTHKKIHLLGSRFGGSLGLLYCFGQAVGCALNVLGFGESMAGLIGFENNKWAIRGFATGAVLLLSVINVAGVKWVVKLQFLLLLVLLFAGLDFMVGSFVGEDPGAYLIWSMAAQGGGGDL